MSLVRGKETQEIWFFSVFPVSTNVNRKKSELETKNHSWKTPKPLKKKLHLQPCHLNTLLTSICHYFKTKNKWQKRNQKATRTNKIFHQDTKYMKKSTKLATKLSNTAKTQKQLKIAHKTLTKLPDCQLPELIQNLHSCLDTETDTDISWKS